MRILILSRVFNGSMSSAVNYLFIDFAFSGVFLPIVSTFSIRGPQTFSVRARCQMYGVSQLLSSGDVAGQPWPIPKRVGMVGALRLCLQKQATSWIWPGGLRFANSCSKHYSLHCRQCKVVSKSLLSCWLCLKFCFFFLTKSFLLR